MPHLGRAWFQPLNLESDLLVLKFAVPELNLSHYKTEIGNHRAARRVAMTSAAASDAETAAAGVVRVFDEEHLTSFFDLEALRDAFEEGLALEGEDRGGAGDWQSRGEGTTTIATGGGDAEVGFNGDANDDVIVGKEMSAAGEVKGKGQGQGKGTKRSSAVNRVLFGGEANARTPPLNELLGPRRTLLVGLAQFTHVILCSQNTFI